MAVAKTALENANPRKGKLYRPPAFDDLSDKELVLFYNVSRIVNFNQGDTIIRQGDTTRSFFVVLSGSIGIYRDFDGVQREVDKMGRGSLLGEISFVRNTPRSATAIAAEPARIIEVSSGAFETLPVKTQLKIFKNAAAIATDRVERMMRQSMDTENEKELIYDYICKKQSKTENALSSDLIQDILNKIPKLPMYATQLTAKLLDEKTTPQEVGDSIKSDPSLAGIVMKMVNSSFYNFPQKIADLNRAVVILGFNNLFQIVLQEGVKNTMPQTEDFKKLQTRSYITSLIANEISCLSTREKSGSNSTIAILHDIGQSVILLLKKRNPKISALIDSLDHTKLGAALLGNWELPESLCKVVQYQDYPEFSPPTKLPGEILDELSVLYLSRVCYARLVDDEEHDSSSFFNDYARVLNFTGQGPDAFVKEKIVPALLKIKDRLPQELKYSLQRGHFNAS
ncbi:hypothetical protein MNBD_NITROSPINAE03-1655 [hydrothermal vent metagenome]|uniref:HDOD domain-containing protein n=1 Tax=hydrothermal vent metagenome TaxID=652676 RepID=A0A3B1CMN1_9ZZZZ